VKIFDPPPPPPKRFAYPRCKSYFVVGEVTDVPACFRASGGHHSLEREPTGHPSGHDSLGARPTGHGLGEPSLELEPTACASGHESLELKPGGDAWGGIAWKGGELGALGSCFRAWQPGTQAWGCWLGGSKAWRVSQLGALGDSFGASKPRTEAYSVCFRV